MFLPIARSQAVPMLRMSALACLLSLAGIAAAQAQTPGNRDYGPVVSGKTAPRVNAPAPPPGLPGTVANRDRAVSAERTQQADLPPTEALFDAINRGDLIAARDALSRGADLNGTNVLGMTPLDQSIDLSRNDITFLLISLRNAQGGLASAPPPPGAGKPDARTAAKSGAKTDNRTAVPIPGPRAVAATPVTVTRQAPRPMADAAPLRPPAGGGGNPNAQSGFLGFGG
jgi:hypothetical protein